MTELVKSNHHHTTLTLARFSYDFEMKTHEQNRNKKRTEIERFDWFIERIQTTTLYRPI